MKLSAAHLRLLQEARERVNVSFVASLVVIFLNNFMLILMILFGFFRQKRIHPAHPLIQGIIYFFHISFECYGRYHTSCVESVELSSFLVPGPFVNIVINVSSTCFPLHPRIQRSVKLRLTSGAWLVLEALGVTVQDSQMAKVVDQVKWYQFCNWWSGGCV